MTFSYKDYHGFVTHDALVQGFPTFRCPWRSRTIIVNATRYPPRPERRPLTGSEWREREHMTKGTKTTRGRKGEAKHRGLLSQAAAHSTREMLLVKASWTSVRELLLWRTCRGHLHEKCRCGDGFVDIGWRNVVVVYVSYMSD